MPNFESLDFVEIIEIAKTDQTFFDFLF